MEKRTSRAEIPWRPGGPRGLNNGKTNGVVPRVNAWNREGRMGQGTPGGSRRRGGRPTRQPPGASTLQGVMPCCNGLPPECSSESPGFNGSCPTLPTLLPPRVPQAEVTAPYQWTHARLPWDAPPRSLIACLAPPIHGSIPSRPQAERPGHLLPRNAPSIVQASWPFRPSRQATSPWLSGPLQANEGRAAAPSGPWLGTSGASRPHVAVPAHPAQAALS